MNSTKPIDYFLSGFLALLTLSFGVLIIILLAKKAKKFPESDHNDIKISSFHSLNFTDDDSIIAYNESTPNLGLAGRLILDCFSGMCDKEYQYYEDDGWETGHEFQLDYNCSKQCSYNDISECTCVNSFSKYGDCSRKYDDKYDNEKYCYADNVIYFWKGKKYIAIQNEVYSYYDNAKLKEEECPKGTINCGIIDDNENKLCVSSSSSCPINYLSENKIDENQFISSVIIGDKTFYYTFVDDYRNKRKIIGGLIADTDLLLNNNNDKKVLIDTNNISGFLADNKNLYKEVKLGFDPYKEGNIDKRGKSYLRYFFNEKVDLPRLRNNIETYNFNYTMNKDYIKDINRFIKIIGIFGLIATVLSLLAVISIIKIPEKFPIFGCLFIIFNAVTLTMGCINISDFNKLKDKDNNKFERIINLIIVILGFVLVAYYLFLAIFYKNLRGKCSCNIFNKNNKESSTEITNKNMVTDNNEIIPNIKG